MSKIKVLSINVEKEVALLAVEGQRTKLGLIPEKSGLVRIDPEVFTAEVGDVIEDEALKYESVGTRTSVSSDGSIFNWLVL